jgi:diguanylate cyclase (GGDEF)-like protein
MEHRDKLTQLYTDDFLKSGLDNEMLRARRFKRELAFVLLQPDIPESVRQDMIYMVLKQLGRCVDEQTRQIDMGIRWGNQVLLVLPETTMDGAQRVAGKVREAFESITFTHPDTQENFQGKLHQAICIFPDDGDERDVLLTKLRDIMKALITPV